MAARRLCVAIGKQYKCSPGVAERIPGIIDFPGSARCTRFSRATLEINGDGIMVILGLGSNIGDRTEHLRTAIAYLKNIKAITIEKISPVYESEALIPPDHQGKSLDRTSQQYAWDLPYLNLAIKISTSLAPEQLIVELKTIEKRMEREHNARWYPRNMDIDILAWDNHTISTDKLTIPHVHLESRPFALWPLFDVAPDWVHPILKKSAAELVGHWGGKFSGQAPLKTRQVNADITPTQLVAAINVTPNSFSDGGFCFTPENALLKAKKCVEEGAAIVDIGAEATSPTGIAAISWQEEWQRLLPVLNLIKAELPQTKISIDTYHVKTAEKVLNLGIDYLNDVTGFRDPSMRALARAAQIPFVFMHSLSVPARRDLVIPEDHNPVTVIFDWAKQQIDLFLQEGFLLDNLIFDVGIGFGNTAAQAFTLLKHIEKFHELGVKLFVGHSRKSFLNLVTQNGFANRDNETAIITGMLAKKNVHFLRVHEIAMNKRALHISQLI